MCPVITDISLGRLELVDLKTVWEEGEALSFTPWLAREENLDLLGDAIGIELELETTESAVGPFRADILCKNLADSTWVLIENQLGKTDHGHLGQLMTYAAGLDAVAVVWIAANFTDEHRAALDWLNRITPEKFRFFGVQIELWRIGSSPPAPKFHIVSKPNDWTDSVQTAAQRAEGEALSDLRKLYIEYWQMFGDLLRERKSALKPSKPQPQQWMPFAIGRAGFQLTANLEQKRHRIRSEIFIHDQKGYFYLLQQQAASIENEFGGPLIWEPLEDRKGTRITVIREIGDFADKAQWPAFCTWHADTLERLHRVFRDRIRQLDLSDLSPAT